METAPARSRPYVVTSARAEAAPARSTQVGKTLFVDRLDHPAEILAGEDVDVEMVDFLMRVAAVIGQHAVAVRHHAKIAGALKSACDRTDKPIAGLLQDLRQRGLLDDTLVLWGGEMGRLPVIQFREGLTKRDKVGRDHNTYGFSMWLAGGGFKRGCVYGATDDFGHHATENVVNHYDYHATLLHQFGIDHSQLLYKRNARDQTLTDGQDGRIVGGILA